MQPHTFWLLRIITQCHKVFSTLIFRHSLDPPSPTSFAIGRTPITIQLRIKVENTLGNCVPLFVLIKKKSFLLCAIIHDKCCANKKYQVVHFRYRKTAIELTNSWSARKFFSIALATAPSATDTLSSEPDHSVNMGPHSFNSAKYSAKSKLQHCQQ